MRHPYRFALSLGLTLATSPLLHAQMAASTIQDSTLLTLQRVHASADFQADFFGPTRWMEEGEAYTTLERPTEGQGSDLVRYQTRTGSREVMIPAARFQVQGDTVPLNIENYSWSPNRNMVLIYTNSQPVWRTNTRGDYWTLDRTSGQLRKLGGPAARPSTLMFAKFSPDGSRIEFGSDCAP